MSFLREIISSAEELEIEQLKQKIPALKCEVFKCKDEILKYLDEIYIYFLRMPTEMPPYVDKLESSKEELNLITHKLFESGIKKSPVCNNVLKNLNEDVEVISKTLLEISDLYWIQAKSVEMKNNYSGQNYSECVRVLKEIEIIMNDSTSLNISNYFQKNIALQKSSMFFHFEELINATFIVSLMDQGKTASFKFENNLEVINLIKHIYQYDNHVRTLDILSDFLWEFVFLPIITCIVKVTNNECELTIHVTKRHVKQHYNEVYKKLYKVAYFFENCLNITLCDSTNITLLEYIGNQLKDKISLSLINHCLKYIRPPDCDPFDYAKLTEETEKLLHHLKFSKIISDDSILEYARDMENIHVNKQCEKFLAHAKMLMNQKNNEVTQVGMSFPNDGIDEISDFPAFSISSIAQEILQLIEKILMEMKQSSKVSCTRLFKIVLNLLDYYMKNGNKHEEEIMARQTALFHNNCIYIANELEEWNVFYSVMFKDAINIPLFKNEAYQLLILADETLNSFLHKQKTILRGYLCTSEDKCGEAPMKFSEKQLRQCFVQIYYLKDAWCEILSTVVYNKSMGVLFNFICDHFIKGIFECKEYKAETKQKLSEIFNSIIKNAQLCFLKADLKHFVACWEKFLAVSSILNSSLIEIETNIGSMTSCLKTDFSIQELKGLIRTLFEDSQKRTMILSKLCN